MLKFEWNPPLEKVFDSLEQDSSNTLQKAGARLGNYMIEATPFDSRTLQAGWNYSVGSPDYTTPQLLRGPRAAAMGWGKTKPLGTYPKPRMAYRTVGGRPWVVYLTNAVPYAGKVNSKHHFFDATLQNWPRAFNWAAGITIRTPWKVRGTS